MEKHLNQRRSKIVFKHFSRNPFALFSVLGREVRIGVLTIATLNTAVPALGQLHVSHTDRLRTKTDTIELNTAEVLASRTPISAYKAARQVTILGRKELSAAGVTSINDVLKNATSVDVRQRGAQGIQTDVSIDGGTFDQVTYMVNGFPISNPQTGHNAADFPVNLDDIDHIEIIQGAATRGFGSQAFSGVINIVTKKAPLPKSNSPIFSWGAEGGSYGTFNNALRLSQQIKKIAFSISHNIKGSDGAVENSDFRKNNFFGTAVFQLPRFTLQTQSSVQWARFGANTFYSGAYPNQWEATRRFTTGIRASIKTPIIIEPQISWVRNVDHFQLIRTFHQFENFNRGNVLSAMLTLRKKWSFGTSVIGSEWRYEDILSTNLGVPMKASNYVKVRGENTHYTRRKDRTNVSIFAEQNFVWDRWSMSLGISGEKNSSIHSGMRFYPGIDVSYQPTSKLRLFASANKSMRLPTFTDLFYKSPTHQGNTNLKAEENTSFHIGGNWKSAVIALQATAFYNRGDHMIDWVMFHNKDKFHATTFQLDNIGFNSSATIDLKKIFGEKQPLNWITFGYAFIHQNKHDQKAYFKSNYALEYLRHKFTIQLHHRIYKDLYADWNLRLQQREGNYLVYKNAKATGELHPYGTHAILDLKLAWSRKYYDLYANFSNITATRYFDLGNVPQPRFTFMVGMKIYLHSWKNFLTNLDM